MPLQCRLATTDDAPTLAALNRRLIEDEKHRNTMTAAGLEARMRGWLGGAYEAVLFEDDGAAASGVVGYALFRREAQWVYLRQFYIDRPYRRRGLGREALAWLAANAWADSPRIRLEVLAGNAAAIAFWRAVGFREYCVTMEWEREGGEMA